jgi:hypothetical protein
MGGAPSPNDLRSPRAHCHGHRSCESGAGGRSSETAALSHSRALQQRVLGQPPLLDLVHFERLPSLDAHARFRAESGRDGRSAAVSGNQRCQVRILAGALSPKFPPPPPRQAQYRSAFVSASTRRARPSAVTIVAASRLSEVSPKRRPESPCPPPSASPAMPTDGHAPPGTSRPLARQARVQVDQLAADAERRPAVRDPDAAQPLRSTTTPFGVVE